MIVSISAGIVPFPFLLLCHIRRLFDGQGLLLKVYVIYCHVDGVVLDIVSFYYI